jgi:hypothetical protein
VKKNNSTQTNKIDPTEFLISLSYKAKPQDSFVDLDDLRFSTPELKGFCKVSELGDVSPSLASLKTADSLMNETPLHKVVEPSSKLESAPIMKIFLSHDS